MKRLIISLSIALVSACVHSDSFIGPNGEKGIVISCNGALRSMADCYNRAAEACGGGYKIVGGSQETISTGQTMAGGNQTFSTFNWHKTVRELTVVCQ